MPAVEVSASLVAAAVGGDQRALEQLLRTVADDVHRLARRMLWHPEDAEDATQEILVKVATRLSSFRGDARVTTMRSATGAMATPASKARPPESKSPLPTVRYRVRRERAGAHPDFARP